MPSGDGVGGPVCFWVVLFVLKPLVSLVSSGRRLGDAGLDAAMGGW